MTPDHQSPLQEHGELQAKCEKLQRELDNERARGIHSCHPDCTRDTCVNRRLRAELETAQGLLRRASKQIMEWAARYGEHDPAWLPPAGDVQPLEDIDGAIPACARKDGA